VPRKTIEVTSITQRVNRALVTRDSDLFLTTHPVTGERENMTPEQAFRLGMIHVLESVLHSTGNYHGYSFQAGIVNFSADPPVITGDETRRIYQ
jgi:hypothetical protein